MILIPNAEKMNAAAQNCLLKTLEEPPEATVFFLMTDQPAALRPDGYFPMPRGEVSPAERGGLRRKAGLRVGGRADDAAKKRAWRKAVSGAHLRLTNSNYPCASN